MPSIFAVEAVLARRRASCDRSSRRSQRADIIGVSVNETSSETAMAMAIVTPNEFMNRPTMPAMNATGRKTAISESDVARTAMPDFLRPFDRGLGRRHLLLFHEAEDVLEHDDGVVDDDADRQRQRQQRDDVEREVLVTHRRERGDDRAGDGDGGDDRRPRAAEEVEQHAEGRRARRPAAPD